MKEEPNATFESKLPGLSKIKDLRLKEKILATWVRVIREGNFNKIEDIPFSIETPEISLVLHLRCVLEIALNISEIIEKELDISVNHDLLIAAVLLHDISKAFEYNKKNDKYYKTKIGKQFIHGFWGACLAFEASFSQELVHLISSHSLQSPVPPQIIEGIILHYADYAHADIVRFHKGLKLFLKGP